MHLLLVNDDGIGSPALALLAAEAKNRGHRVTVTAPAAQQSAKSHAFTVFTPLLVRRTSVPGADSAWAVEGTPVDCTRLGLMALTGRGDEPPVDLVISGINDGYNAGLATYVSGTVGAAREAAFIQGRALAVSAAAGSPESTLRRTAALALLLAERACRCSLPPLCVLNLNVPPLAPEALPAPRLVDISRAVYQDGYEERLSPRGNTYFWLQPEAEIPNPTPGSDADLLARGCPTLSLITPDGCATEAHWAAQLLQGLVV